VMGAVGGPGGPVMAVTVPQGRAGMTHLDDWDALGQRLSASGSVRFEEVRVGPDEVLGEVGEEPYSTMVTPGIQLGFCNLYLGLAQGALEHARRVLLARRGSWFLSGVERYADDVLVQRTVGDLVARISALEAFADRWNTEYDDVMSLGGRLTAADRTRAEIGIAQLKVVATETALDVAQRVFEVTGSSSARSEVGLDLYWRNVRTHSLHDPVDYKRVEVGAHYLNGTVQPITLYT